MVTRWRSVKEISLSYPSASWRASQDTLFHTWASHPEKLQRTLMNIQGVQAGQVGVAGQGDLNERYFYNSLAEWSSQSEYRDREEVLPHGKGDSSAEISLISKTHVVLLHLAGLTVWTWSLEEHGRYHTEEHLGGYAACRAVLGDPQSICCILEVIQIWGSCV